MPLSWMSIASRARCLPMRRSDGSRRSRVRYLKYWVSKEAKTVNCLVEAPNAEAATHVHVEAVGQGANELYEVDERT